MKFDDGNKLPHIYRVV